MSPGWRERSGLSRLAWQFRRDLILAAGCLVVGAVWCWWLASRLPDALYGAEATDSWFDNDLGASLSDMVDRFSSAKSDRHPLFSAIVFPPTKLLVKAAGLAPLHAAQVVTAATAGAWLALLFVLLRAIGCRRLDAGVITLLGLFSAAGIFLLPVAEAFALGSLTIVACLLWAAADERGHRSTLVEMLVSAGTLGITVTNWMVGLAASALRRRPADAVQVSLGALGLVAALWAAQSIAFPELQFFLGQRYQGERAAYLLAPEAGGPGRIVAAFAAHPVVMPAMEVVDRPGTGRWELLSAQDSVPGSAGSWGMVALAAWILLLAAGVVALIRHRGRPRFRLLLAATLVGQLALHLVFGYETFLYSPHWLPALLVVAGFATLTRWRRAVLALVTVCLIAAAVNNLRQFGLAVQFIENQDALATQRRAVEPAPAWPGGAGQQVGPLVHFPGNRFWDDGAPERSGGGGLWPAFDSFYIGFLVVDGSGRPVLESSDTAAGRFRFSASQTPSGEHLLQSESRYYRAAWRTGAPGQWHLDLQVLAGGDHSVLVVLRGFGWQFGRIKELHRDPAGVTINGRWAVRVEPGTPSVLGEEPGHDWRTAVAQGDSVSSRLGLGFARLGPLPRGSHVLRVEDTRRFAGSNQRRGVLSYGALE